MSVYVDDMRAPFGRVIMCHMIADTPDELHAMADRIGLPRQWFYGDRYHVAPAQRALAVAAGAIEITWWELGTMITHHRRTGWMPPLDPDPVVRDAQLAAIRKKLSEMERAA